MAQEWKPEELLKYVWDENPGFAAGQGWDYSDTNYILLGMIIEQLTGKKYYELLYKEILEPHKLVNTKPQLIIFVIQAAHYPIPYRVFPTEPL